MPSQPRVLGVLGSEDNDCVVAQPLNSPPLRLLALSLPAMLDAARIVALLQPFVGSTVASPDLTDRLQIYLELLLRWNARINLTSVRGPEQIVTRHFGESLFAACVLRDAGALSSSAAAPPTLADVGSGAGFPGIPTKLLVPESRLTLIESQNKKATFLREVIRALDLKDAEVFCGRAEFWNHMAGVVTLRAVENFERALPVASRLVAEPGTLCVLIGASQVPVVRQALALRWKVGVPVPIPASEGRVVLTARRNQ